MLIFSRPFTSLFSTTVVILLSVFQPVLAQDGRFALLAEESGFAKTGRYKEMVDFADGLAEASDLVTTGSIGKSSEGREIRYLVVSETGISDANEARRSGKAVVLVQAAIHSGESDGKDAGLALFRDIALKGMHRELLRKAVIVLIPIYNVDGHELFGRYNRINQNGPEEMGFRANSANQNLNRDYLKADTPETRAWLKFWNEWDPDLFIDSHVTDGADYRYNITWEYARHQEAPSALAEWMAEYFEGSVIARVEEKGNLLSPYLQIADRSDPTKGIFTFIATPRYATGYTPLRNRAGLLIEAHSLKDYKTRVTGTYDLLVETIREAGERLDSLRSANRKADLEAESRGGRDSKPFPLALSIDRTPSRTLSFKGLEIRYEDSNVSGARKLVYGDKPIDAEIPWFDRAVVTASVTAPDFYLVPPQWREVIDRLELHGVQFSRLARETLLKVESYRFEEPKWSAFPFEGRITLSAKAVPFEEERVFPAGTVVVPVGQKASAVAIHLLEPKAPDSLFYWGFFNAIFESKEYAETYALEQLAQKMLGEDESLRAEFEKSLLDPEFKASPRKRLMFFYERSPFKEKTGIYPVGRFFGAVPPGSS